MTSLDPKPDQDATAPRYRSGAVARMVRMPVSTLRVWERRYGVAEPVTTASGHRLYSIADVHRLTQLKQLTELGHAIGSIATLSLDQLREVASTHANALAGVSGSSAAVIAPWQVVIVGQALERRLQRPALAHRLGRALQVMAVFDDLAQAGLATGIERVDTLLVYAPVVDARTVDRLKKATDACGARHAALIYGFGARLDCDAIEAAGATVLREVQDDRALAVWLRGLAGTGAVRDPDAYGAPAAPERRSAEDVARRYDDATLTDLAGLSSTIACECPRHLAGLLMQLSQFEAYSADCENRSPADAALHAYLKKVAGTARALFETALERVAIQEGLMLPR